MRSVFRQFQESLPQKQESSDFAPFQKERDEVGNLIGQERRSVSRKHRMEQGRQALTVKLTSRQAKTRFLRDIYTSNTQSAWNSLTHTKLLRKQVTLFIEPEEQQHQPKIPLLLFQKKLPFDELNKQSFRERRSSNISMPTSPKLGRVKIENVPPLGYYDIKLNQKKQPMFVCMDQSKSPQSRVVRVVKSELSSRSASQRGEIITTRQQLITEDRMDKAYQTERMLTEQKFQYMPKHIDIKTLEEDDNKIKEMRMKIRQRFKKY